MSRREDRTEDSTLSWPSLNSRVWKTLWVVLAGLLLFFGPTYVVYILVDVLRIDTLISRSLGFTLFLIGLLLLWYLIRKRIVS